MLSPPSRSNQINFAIGFLLGLVSASVLIWIAVHQQYIQLGKGSRADKVDDDLKAARDKFKETP